MITFPQRYAGTYRFRQVPTYRDIRWMPRMTIQIDSLAIPWNTVPWTAPREYG